ncbi:MAG: hypothetical protein EOO68_37060, partial [Moraxellaceae bacterium]
MKTFLKSVVVNFCRTKNDCAKNKITTCDVTKSSLLKKSVLTAFTAISMCFTPLVFAANTVIDVLVVYTKGTADAYGGD